MTAPSWYITLTVLLSVVISTSGQRQLICYWQSHSEWRPAPGDFKIQDFDSKLCTFVIVAFAGVREEDGIITDLTDPSYYTAAVSLRDTNPDLKILLAVGGWNENPQKFSNISMDITKRAGFASSAAQKCDQYDFDGIDLDWEYPTQRGGRVEDKANFATLVAVTKSALNTLGSQMGRKYYLTVAVATSPGVINDYYNFSLMNRNVDYYHLMAYDLRGYSSGDRNIGHHSPIRSAEIEGPSKELLNMEKIIEAFKAVVTPPTKIILGVGTYGRTYQIKSRDLHKIGDQASKIGNAGPFIKEPGFIGYNEICYEMLRTDTQSQLEMFFDEEVGVPYIFNSTYWAGYDDEESAVRKTDLAVAEGLGGIMIWSLDMDDCNNICGGWYKCPIMTTIKTRLAYHATMNPLIVDH